MTETVDGVTVTQTATRVWIEVNNVETGGGASLMLTGSDAYELGQALMRHGAEVATREGPR